ncbi:hypothetical protein IE81DRAFT_324482 [Ceraceosorus guamensis]|uniref:Mnn4-regulates the mannosylphosphorylation n=1 Tax=Ceraceosorus guamensis TaxID=1522189 RepID=A0A316VZ14_9BASI|nr:hypothetical protein IE81DRAFT_324482 [Ceraceosorus guamensis]PWN41491.1 hypothetical protein IE81DRAFT_324482 [Ceraceosorus guamensis]
MIRGPGARAVRASTFHQFPLLRVSPPARILSTSSKALAANAQSGKPASDNWKHTVKNVKEEAGQVKSSIESAVAGSPGSGAGSSNEGPDSSPSGAADLLGDARSVSSEMFQAVPRPALLWGAAGVLPYISTAGASVYLARQTNLVANGMDTHIDYETASALLLHAQNVQISYGAIILSFLGAIHWGFEFSKYGGQLGNRRYILGIVPLVIGWPSLALSPELALVSQFGAYVVSWFIDLRATTAGWAPKWYSSYRFWLTAAVGTSIIATLAGTNYYNVDKSATSSKGAGEKLKKLVEAQGKEVPKLVEKKAEGDLSGPQFEGKVSGDVQAESADEGDDGYVKIRNPKREEEERKRKEEEEKKKKEEESKKKKEEGGDDKDEK